MVQLYSVIFHILIYSSSLSSIMCSNQSDSGEGKIQQGYKPLDIIIPGQHGDSRRIGLPINNNTKQFKPTIKKVTRPPTIVKLMDENGIVKNISALPTKGVFDHTHRPGSVVWKTPKLKPQQPQNSKDVILGPVYRLPVDHDDTGSQIRMEWNYAYLKVKPENVTLVAEGPNRSIWTITVMEGTKTTATWDLRETPSYSPLIEGFYNLYLYDQRGKDTLPKPGWLLPDKKMRIALYKTEENNHIGEFIAPSECATCYKHIMQGLGKLEDSTVADKRHVNFKLMYVLISLFWILL